VAEGRTDWETPYVRMMTALTAHFARFHEVDAYELLRGLREAGFLNDQDVELVTYQLDGILRYRPRP